jgi:N-acyl-L-homoserine lactone synthetase
VEVSEFFKVKKKFFKKEKGWNITVPPFEKDNFPKI